MSRADYRRRFGYRSAASYRSGPIGTAAAAGVANTHALSLTRPGQGASISDASQTGLDMQHASGDATFECWIYPDSLPTTSPNNLHFIMSKNASGSDQYWLGLRYDGTYQGIAFKVREGNDPARSLWQHDVDLTLSTWVHIAVTFDASAATASQVEFFIDGSSVGNGRIVQNGNISAWADGNATFFIGDSAETSQEYGFDGDIDAPRIWTGIRTEAEIAAAMSQHITSGTNLLSAWHFNNDYTDAVTGTGNDLSASGSPTFITSPLPF